MFVQVVLFVGLFSALLMRESLYISLSSVIKMPLLIYLLYKSTIANEYIEKVCITLLSRAKQMQSQFL